MLGNIQLVTVGNVPRNLLKELAQPVMNTLRVQSLSGAPLTHPQYALNPPRQQFHATAILRRLGSQLQADQLGIVGICDVDLFTPDSEFVFCESDRESRCALISIHRLKSNVGPEILIRRAQTEILDAIGQLLGLSSCDDTHCAMFSARTPQDCDRKGVNLCNDCRHELQRLCKPAS